MLCRVEQHKKVLLGMVSSYYPVIFLAIKPTPVTGIVPKAKKYVFFPIEANKFPK